MNTKIYQFLIFLAVLLLFDNTANAQFTVTRIYTDYNPTTFTYDPPGTGVVWDSQTNTTAISRPRNQHHLLGFVWNGVTYSTGIDDAKLTNAGLTFMPTTFQALPVVDFVPSGGGSIFVQLGERWDGVAGGITGSLNTNVLPLPFTVPVGVAPVLTHGLQGLDLGSAITNVPATSPLTFNFGAITDPSQIGDNIPDIIVTQMAQPSSILDEIWFEDGSGNIIGNVLSINFNNISHVGDWYADFYVPTNGHITANSWINGVRQIRLWAARASDFGLTAANYSSALVLKYHLKGSSDPAFIAYNTNFIILAAANNDSATTMINQPVNINVLDNDNPSNFVELSSFTFPSTATANGGTVSHINGVVTYTPPLDFVGVDTFTYEICINNGGNISCDTAIVTVMVYQNNYIVCSGRNITLNAPVPGSGTYNYVWTLPSSATVLGTTSTGTVSLLVSNASAVNVGVYELEVTNANDPNDTVTYQITLGLNEHCNLITNPMIRQKVKE